MNFVPQLFFKNDKISCVKNNFFKVHGRKTNFMQSLWMKTILLLIFYYLMERFLLVVQNFQLLFVVFHFLLYNGKVFNYCPKFSNKVIVNVIF
jgi:hypothetical protein